MTRGRCGTSVRVCRARTSAGRGMRQAPRRPVQRPLRWRWRRLGRLDEQFILMDAAKRPQHVVLPRGRQGRWRRSALRHDGCGLPRLPECTALSQWHAGALKPDERYAVLQTGEEVLSRRETFARQRSGNRDKAPAPVLQVNVINNTGAEVETVQRSDGGVDVMIDHVEGRLADRAKRGRDPLVKAIGLRREGNALIG
jgi:hypothetical protein